jgi:hypothetical protein
VVDNDPTSGEGFESAVAYAVADELGFDRLGDPQQPRTREFLRRIIDAGRA